MHEGINVLFNYQKAQSTQKLSHHPHLQRPEATRESPSDGFEVYFIFKTSHTLITCRKQAIPEYSVNSGCLPQPHPQLTSDEQQEVETVGTFCPVLRNPGTRVKAPPGHSRITPESTVRYSRVPHHLTGEVAAVVTENVLHQWSWKPLPNPNVDSK